MPGRHAAGPEYVEQLAGSAQARHRLRLILETLAGQRRVGQACAELGIGAVRFHALRRRVLEAALAALEPRPAGRPPRAAVTTQEQLDALHERLDQVSAELQTAQVREQIAVVLPAASLTPEKKTRCRPPQTVRRQTARPRPRRR